MKKEIKQDEIFKMDEEIDADKSLILPSPSPAKMKARDLMGLKKCIANKSRFFYHLNEAKQSTLDICNDPFLADYFPLELAVFINREVFIK